jgi:hypothetical protein
MDSDTEDGFQNEHLSLPLDRVSTDVSGIKKGKSIKAMVIMVSEKCNVQLLWQKVCS